MRNALLFDLGGVLLQLEPERSGVAFDRLGAPNFMSLWHNDTAEKSLARLETGAIGATQFRREVGAALGVQLADEAFDAAFCAMLGDFPPSVRSWLDSLAEKLPLYLLSNNNELHLGHIERRYPWLRSRFVSAYFSQEIGHSKPTEASFRHAIEQSKLMPASTLFVDDSEANIEAARAVGLVGLHLKRNGDVVKSVNQALAERALTAPS